MVKCTAIQLNCTAMTFGAGGGQEADTRSRGSADSRSRSRGKVGNNRSRGSDDTAESLVSTAAVVGRNSRSRSRHRGRGSADETPAEPDDSSFYGAGLKATVFAKVKEHATNVRKAVGLQLPNNQLKDVKEVVFLACEHPLACGYKEMCGVLTQQTPGHLDPHSLNTFMEYYCVKCGGGLNVRTELQTPNGETLTRTQRRSWKLLGFPRP